MSQLEQQMRLRDREMVPRRLVVAMFALMVVSLGLVTFAQLADVPNRGVPSAGTPVATRSVSFVRDGATDYAVLDEAGTVIARSTDEAAGFIGVVGRVVDRGRTVGRIDSAAPVDLIERPNGTYAVHDPLTGKTVSLAGFGDTNIAAIAALMKED